MAVPSLCTPPRRPADAGVYSPILCPYRVQIMYKGIIILFAGKHEGADCQLLGTSLIVTFITLGQCNNLMAVAGI